MLGLEGKPHENVGIGQALDPNTNGPVTHVAVPGLHHRVEVDINDLVQILRHHLGNHLQFVEVEGLVRLDKHVDSDGCEVADSDLVRSGVLHDLGTEVGALDGAEVLLVALPVAGVLVEHVGGPGLNLALDDAVPQLLGLHLPPGSPLPLVLLVESLELLSPDFVEAGALVRTHQRPLPVSLDSLHEEVRHPESVEQVPGSLLLLPVVLPQVQEVEDVRVPGLQVDGEGPGSLVPALVDVPGSVVEDPQHGHEAVTVAVGPGNVGAGGANAVDIEADTSGRLGDEGALLQSVVDSLDGVAGHRQQEAGAELGAGRGRVEQSWGGVSEQLLREQVIRLNGSVNVLAMDPDGNSHQHLLRSLNHLPVLLQEVGSQQGLESKILILEISIIDESSIKLVLVLHDNLVVFLIDHRDAFTSHGVRHVVEDGDHI